MKGEKLFEAFSDLNDDLLQDLDHTSARHTGRFVWKLVLAAAVISLLTVSVIGSVIGSAEIQVTPTEEGCTVMFQNRYQWPTEQIDWYPQTLPEGYAENWIGSNEHHFRSISFRAGKDGRLYLTYGQAKYMPEFAVEGISGGQRTKVGDDQGMEFLLVTQSTDYSSGHAKEIPIYSGWLFWIEEDSKQCFVLRYTAKTELDLIAIAESIEKTEPLTATFSISAMAAVVKLGDYQPQWLPEGYSYVTTYGDPVNVFLNRDYPGYVHRLYRNEQNYEVHLFYEFIPKRYSSKVSELSGETAREQIDLGGIPAQYYETAWGAAYAIVWEREDTEGLPLTFTLYSDGISGTESISKEDLIHMAEQIALVTEADTSSFDTRRPR